ncbi:MAG TPA: hypothetical protein VIC62_16240 [Nakamurella sp.]|jgi:hypothetical protein
MTDTEQTPRTVAEYDAMMVEQADRAGGPILRMSQRVAPLTPTVFLLQRRGVPHLVDVSGSDAGVPRPFTVAEAMTLFGPPSASDDHVVWAASRTVAAHALAIADTATSSGAVPDPATAMRRMFAHLLRAEHTARLLFLPELLHRKYTPTRALLGAPVRQWGLALGLPAPDPREPLTFFGELARLAGEGTAITIGNGSPLKVIATSERSVRRAAEWGGMAFQATQLSAAEACDAAWAAVQRLDRLLTERNLLTGLCSVGTPDPVTPTLVRVDGRARLRVDDDLLITADGAPGNPLTFGFAKLTGYRMVDGALHAQVEPAEQTDRRRGQVADLSGTGLLARVAERAGTVLLSPKPFLRSAAKAYFGARWSGRSVPSDRRVARTVPLDVLLAGG